MLRLTSAARERRAQSLDLEDAQPKQVPQVLRRSQSWSASPSKGLSSVWLGLNNFEV